MSHGKITEVLEPFVGELAAKGCSTRDISAQLQRVHGVKVSHATVAKYLSSRRTERADVAKVVVREQLSQTLTADIKRLDRFAKKAVRLANKNEREPLVWAKLAEQVRKFTEAKLKAAGVNEPDMPKPEEVESARGVMRTIFDDMNLPADAVQPAKPN